MTTRISLLSIPLFLVGALLQADPLVDQLTAQFPAAPFHVLAASSKAAFQISVHEGVASEVRPAGPGVPFTESQRVVVARAFVPAWTALALTPPLPVALSKNHVLLVSFWTRAPEMSQPAQVRAFLEKSSADWTAYASASVAVGPEWKQVFLSCTLGQDIPASGIHLSLHLGQLAQTVELGGLVILDLGTGLQRNQLPHNAITWAGQEADAPWRKQAAAAIETLRRGPLAVKVIDSQGHPVQGAEVHVVQVQRQFTFGSFTSFGEGLFAQNPSGEKYRSFYGTLFDRATVPLYWADWGWLSRKDRFVELAHWAQARGLAMRGHVLVYPGRQFMPASTKNLSAAKLQAAFLKQIREAGEAMKGVPFREVDVTNELRDLTEIPGLVGREGVAEWFRQARASFPTAKLALNENTILTEGGATEANQDTLLDWYRYLKSQGVAPDVLGFQSHFGENLTGPETVWKILDRFSRETDAEFQITEFDINTSNEEAKAAYTRDFLTAVFAHPRVTAVTLWGFWQGDHWRPDAVEWNTDWTPRPAGVVLNDLLGKQWRTDETWKTDGEGTASGRVWLGTLEVTAKLGKASSMQRVTVGRDGQTLVLTLP